ncbi:MAG: hypothetical protein WAO74_01305 [Polaribacter sp.]|uniref:hypothetical protein n=1 Tax=Polaribacter sp. TaxID=1920175 RepID=UPI003BB09D64
MKKLKRNNRILSYLICFSLLAFVNISCNENDDLEILEESETNKKEALTESMAKKGIKTGRSRMKKRSNGLYRASIVVNNDNKDEVSTIALAIEKKEGVLNETKTYYLDYYTTVKNEKYYTFADIKFDGKDLENQEVTIKVTLLDANKKPISTSTGTTTIAGLSKANIKRTRLKERRNGLYKMSAEIENNEDNEVATIAVKVNDLQGNTTTFNTTLKNNNTINADFSFEKASISQKMSVTYVLKDFYGDEINTFKEEVSLESNLKVGKVSLNKNSNGLYTTVVAIKNDTENEIEKISLTIEKEEGIAEKTITYDLKYFKTKKGIKYYTSQNVALIESKVNIIPVIVTISTKTDTDIIYIRAPRYKGERG